ncbi:unnamed protein product [Durusdinium trenchii]|uniref:Uncharacterized protein n=1 Tax=Durusdinium trenchii TaxID=1381693 RepID=A0ABP0IED3_9DINO
MLQQLCPEQTEVSSINCPQELAASLELPGNNSAVIVWIAKDGLELEWRWLSASEVAFDNVTDHNQDRHVSSCLQQ